uniref:Uncharacterized protein n=1 Tax=Pithovirus LCPAC403 TaxID=2506596 RepID=A0A481ZCQ8_9VIRU|nr:MAG: uncharacterized protein LCPAC403_02560 [Pithovirus LCPAC403]
MAGNKKCVHINTMIAALVATRRSSNRIKNCDAIIRNTIFADRMCTFIDGAFTLLNCYIISANEGLEEKDQIPQDQIGKWIEIVAQIDKEWSDDMNSLIEYIQQPMFSPDHPKGAGLMQVSKKNFDEKSQLDAP